MRGEQRDVLHDVLAGLDERGWAVTGPASLDKPVLEVPFVEGTVVVSVAWRPARVESLPSVDGVTTGPFLRKDVEHR